MGDFCDGELFNTHPLYDVDSNALQLILYFDEVEPFNTLGSAAGKHKLGNNIINFAYMNVTMHMHMYACLFSFGIGLFYYTKGNLRPELRSTHRAIQLVACVTSPCLKRYGFESILKPFIEDVKTLNQVYNACMCGIMHNNR